MTPTAPPGIGAGGGAQVLPIPELQPAPAIFVGEEFGDDYFESGWEADEEDEY